MRYLCIKCNEYIDEKIFHEHFKECKGETHGKNNIHR